MRALQSVSFLLCLLSAECILRTGSRTSTAIPPRAMLNNVPRRTSARLANAPPGSAAPASPDDESVRLEDVLTKRPRRVPPPSAPPVRDDARPSSSRAAHPRTRPRPAPAPAPASAPAARQPSQSKRKRTQPRPTYEVEPARKAPRARKSHVVGGFRFHAEDEDEVEDEGEEPDPVPSTPPRRTHTQSRFEPLPADLMGETPIARRNQAARRGDAIGLGLPPNADGRRRTRSSLSGKAARRVSSLRNGSIAFPHPSVPDEHLHRHCADTLDPVGRLTYLLAWCAERARPPEAEVRTEQDRRLQQAIAQTLADLDSHELSLSWLSRPGRREELAARKVIRATGAGLAPHPRNVANAERIAELEAAEKRISTEVQGWQDASQRVDACQRRTGLLAEALERVWPTADQESEWDSDAESEAEDATTAETWATLEAFVNQTRTRPDEDLPEMAHPPGRDSTPPVDAGEEDAALRSAAGRALAWARRDSVPLPPAWRALASDAAAELDTAPPSRTGKGKARQSGLPSAQSLADPDEARNWILSDHGTTHDPRWADMESQVCSHCTLRTVDAMLDARILTA